MVSDRHVVGALNKLRALGVVHIKSVYSQPSGEVSFLENLSLIHI